MMVRNNSKHIEKLNREMGEVRTDVSWLVKDIAHLRTGQAILNKRLWWILGTVVVLGILNILIMLAGG